MSLLYEGKTLDNENTFEETGVENLSTIHLVLALNGGGGKKKKRKTYTNVKKNKHRHKNVELRTL